MKGHGEHANESHVFRTGYNSDCHQITQLENIIYVSSETVLSDEGHLIMDSRRRPRYSLSATVSYCRSK